MSGGTCSVCRVSGPPGRRRDFLCGRCAHPIEVRTYCANCGDRKRYGAARGIIFLHGLFSDRQLSLGAAIRLGRCVVCDLDRAPGLVEVYVIQGMPQRTMAILEYLVQATETGNTAAPAAIPGLCAACYAPVGPPNCRNPSLCKRCARPNEIRTHCANCGERQEFSGKEAEDVVRRNFPGRAYPLGSVICTEYCTQCDAGRAPGAIRIESMRNEGADLTDEVGSGTVAEHPERR